MFDLIETDTPERPAIKQLRDGIYFDLPENIYHAQQRLSSSGIQDLLVSEGDFWARSWLNPANADKDKEPTKAQILGRAYHTARLEPDLLLQRFAQEFDAQDCPDGLTNDTEVRAALKLLQPQKDAIEGLLANDTAVKEALAAMGQPKAIAGEDAAARALRLRSLRPEVQIWSLIVADWEAINGPMTAPADESAATRAQRLIGLGYTGKIFAIERAAYEAQHAGKTFIAREYWAQVLADMELIKSNPEVRQYLIGGEPEVSILWTDQPSGLKMKARIDYLRPNEGNDFKTFENMMRKPLRRCLADAFRYNRYYIQSVVYHDAMEEIRAGLEVAGPATLAQVDLIEAIRANPIPMGIRYTFQQKGGVPNLLTMNVKLYHGMHPGTEAAAAGADPETLKMMRAKYGEPSLLHRRAQLDIASAKRKFAACFEIFADGEPWRTIEADTELTDDDFNQFWLDMRDV